MKYEVGDILDWGLKENSIYRVTKADPSKGYFLEGIGFTYKGWNDVEFINMSNVKVRKASKLEKALK